MLRMACLALVCALAPIGAAQADTASHNAQVLADTLRAEGYSDIRIISRIFGGYFVEGRLDNIYAVFVLPEGDGAPELADVYNDADEDEVLSSAELSARVPATEILALYAAALATNTTPTETDIGGGNVTETGFSQTRLTLMGTGAISDHRTETVGMMTLRESSTVESSFSLSSDMSMSSQSQFSDTSKTIDGFKIRSAGAEVGNSNVELTEFSALTINAPGFDQDALRSEIQANAPTSESISNSFTVPDRAAIEAQILALVPVIPD
jgi:hypothetical protein